MSGTDPAPALILASGSPRRRALLEAAGVAFEPRPPGLPEERAAGEAPEAFALRLSRSKALFAAERAGSPPRRFALGADTIVVLGDEVLGKPRDAEDAVRLLRRLVGREHEVITAVAVADSASLQTRSRAVRSRVRMRPAGDDEIRRYVETGEPLDKAGAYGLQGEGRRFVLSVEGSETCVIGLPLEETLALLRECGVRSG